MKLKTDLKEVKSSKKVKENTKQRNLVELISLIID